MHSQIVVNPRFHGGTKIGKGRLVLAAKIGPGGPVLTGDRFFRYSTMDVIRPCLHKHIFDLKCSCLDMFLNL